MKRTTKIIFLLLLSLTGLLFLSGCRSLAEEDPNDQQLPWATPAGWEGRLPGMPTGGM
jgi:hypothetical protein